MPDDSSKKVSMRFMVKKFIVNNLENADEEGSWGREDSGKGNGSHVEVPKKTVVFDRGANSGGPVD